MKILHVSYWLLVQASSKRSRARKARVRPKSARQGTEAVTITAGDNSASLHALTEALLRQLPRGITVTPVDNSVPRRTTQGARQGEAVTITVVDNSASIDALTEAIVRQLPRGITVTPVVNSVPRRSNQSARQGTEAITITAGDNTASLEELTEAVVRQLPRGITVTPVDNSAPRRSTQSARQGTDAVTITVVYNSASLAARTEAVIRQLPRGITVIPVDNFAPRRIPSQDTVREVRPAVTITAIDNPEEPTMTQQYSLRWNNHQPNFISMFTTLLNTQTLVDVTLSADGKQLLAHKVVLSACSTYFQTLFVENPSPHPIVILKDVTYADLRAMVDFMYCGEVNVTEEQLPQVLDTAKLLKVKGLTDMPPDSTLTRSQGPSAEFQSQGDSLDSTRHSPAASPSNKRRRRRKSSTSSTQLNVLENEHGRADVSAQTVEAITLSSVPQQRRMREYHEIRTIDNSQQVDDTTEQENMNVEPIGMENTTPAAIPQVPANPNSSDGWHRRTKHFKRQSRVPDEQNIRKQTSEPLPPPPAVSRSTPTLQKHESYPQYSTSKAIVTRKPRLEQEVGSLLIRAVCSAERQSSSTSATSTSASFESATSDGAQATRASHTPAVRSGPPLSCNFCWNTVDECGRILRRKTQYHCPECRTNLCIVPCFHEYHDGPESDSNNANAR